MEINCCCSFAKSCLTLCDPMDCSIPGFPVLYHPSGACSNSSIESVMPSNHLILCYPLLFLPSIFPSIRVFSNKLAPCIRWPKYWSFSFSISPSNEYSGLISFSIDWFDLLVTKAQTNFWPTQHTQETGLHPMSHRFSISKAPEAGRGKAGEF